MNEELERVNREPSKGRNQLLAIVLVLILALGAGFGGGVAALYYMTGGFDFGAENGITAGEKADIQINVREDVTVAEAIAQKVLPSVVGISTVTEQEGGSFFGFGNGYKYDAQSVGTGVIVHESGYILTNSHVVNDGDTKSLTVSLYDGSDVEGTVLWSDANLDLAVVKVESTGLTAAEMGDSDEVNIGAYAAAIGNPLGLDFERSMSQGIISGLNRSIDVGSGYGSSGMEGLIQTDATINSGNSGGPLLNSRGQVIGINTAKAASGEGMGFAIPINVAKPIVEQIMDNGTFLRAYIGITGIGLEEQTYYAQDELMEEFGTSEGIYVASVLPGGGAEEAGLREGDVIVRFEGEEVGTMNRLNTMLVAHRPGDEVRLLVFRDGKEKDFRVTLTDGNTTL
ncbi:MAG: trypsin-like peptidase domain-containing protein [Eubacteriales bacterium]|nr:trypsin-like peptidase domain-containing protein [Eubacteriales bacterium]NLV70251.1 PDZ domain-containing protein [Clostridiales bacterium]